MSETSQPDASDPSTRELGAAGKRATPGRAALIYEPAKVAWATAEFVRESPPWIARSAVYLAFGLAVTAALYAHFTEVPVSIEAPGTLVTEVAPVLVKSQVTFRVGSIKVKENQRVEANSPLIVSDEQITETDVDRLESDRERALELVADLRRPKCAGCAARAQALADQAFRQLQRGSGSLSDNLSPVQELLKELASTLQLTEQSDSVTQGLRRQIELGENKLKEIRRQRAERLLAAQVEQITSEIVSAKAQLAERRQSNLNALNQVTNRLEVRLNALPAALEQYRKAMVVVAPISGIVTNLTVNGAGDLVTASQQLMAIVPSDSELMAELAVSNRDISQVAVGQEALLKLDALPEREFGTARAKVEVIPVSASRPNEQAPPVYLVRVRLERQGFERQGVSYPFKLGMTLQGLLVSKRQSLLQLGIKKLFNLKDEFLAPSRGGA